MPPSQLNDSALADLLLKSLGDHPLGDKMRALAMAAVVTAVTHWEEDRTREPWVFIDLLCLITVNALADYYELPPDSTARAIKMNLPWHAVEST